MCLRCPNCYLKIHARAEACPYCDFSVQKLSQVYEHEEVSTDRLSDAVGVLDHQQLRVLTAKIQEFDWLFPQFFLVIHVLDCADEKELTRYGMWLLNRGVFTPNEDDTKSRDGMVLLLLAPRTQLAVILAGALVEPNLSDRLLFDVLCQAHSLWQEELYLEGLIEVINRLSLELKRRANLVSFLHPLFS